METFSEKYNKNKTDMANNYFQELAAMLYEAQNYTKSDINLDENMSKYHEKSLSSCTNKDELKKLTQSSRNLPKNVNSSFPPAQKMDKTSFVSNQTQTNKFSALERDIVPNKMTQRQQKYINGSNNEISVFETTLQEMLNESPYCQQSIGNSVNEIRGNSSNTQLPTYQNTLAIPQIAQSQANIWTNFQQTPQIPQIPQIQNLNQIPQLLLDPFGNSIDQILIDEKQLYQLNSMAQNLYSDSGQSPEKYLQQCQVFLMAPSYQTDPLQQQVYLVSQGPEVNFWQSNEQQQLPMSLFNNYQQNRLDGNKAQLSQVMRDASLLQQNVMLNPLIQIQPNFNSNGSKSQENLAQNHNILYQMLQHDNLELNYQQLQYDCQQFQQQVEQLYQIPKLDLVTQTNQQIRQDYKTEQNLSRQLNWQEDLKNIPPFPANCKIPPMQEDSQSYIDTHTSIDQLFGNQNRQDLPSSISKSKQKKSQSQPKERNEEARGVSGESEQVTVPPLIPILFEEKPSPYLHNEVGSQDQICEERQEIHLSKRKIIPKERGLQTEEKIKASPAQDSNGLTNTIKHAVKDTKKVVERKKKLQKINTEVEEVMNKEETEKMETDQANLISTVSSTPENSLPIAQEINRKLEPKKQSLTYEESLSIMKYLTEFDWLEGTPINHKLLPSKLLTSPVVWFLICAEYFPRAGLHQTKSKQFAEVFEKLQKVMQTFTQRISRESVNSNFLSNISSDESSFLKFLSQSVRRLSDANSYTNLPSDDQENSLFNPIMKPNYDEEDDQWIMETRSFLVNSIKKLPQDDCSPNFDENLQNFDTLSKIDLTDLIALYEKDLSATMEENTIRRDELQRKFEAEQTINSNKMEAEDVLRDITLTFSEEADLLALMEKKQNEVNPNTLQEKSRQLGQGAKALPKCRTETAPEDIVCQVCNDGDFTDNNLIVFCAKCNVSVHQKCYGINILPEDDWICDLCINFGVHGKYLRCPLCDKRGGAMKPSSIKVDTDMFEYLNPDYNAFLRTYSKCGGSRNVDHKPLSFKDFKRNKQFGSKSKLSNKQPNDSQFYLEELDYNFHEIADQKFTDEELRDEPKPFYIWVHLTCTNLISELYFGDRIQMTKIMGLEKIERERFKLGCGVCKKTKGGATVKCTKELCSRVFHPECARRANYYIDKKENNSNLVQYHLYCKEHTPLQLKRTLEAKEKKKKEEIFKFFKAVEKYYFTCHQNFGPEELNLASQIEESEGERTPIKRKKSISALGTGPGSLKKKEDDHFMKLVKKYKAKSSKTPWIISLQAEANAQNENIPGFKLIEIKVPLDKNRELSAEDDVWELFSYKDLTPKQKYKKYIKILAKQNNQNTCPQENLVIEKEKDVQIEANLTEKLKLIDDFSNPESKNSESMDVPFSDFKLRLIKKSYFAKIAEDPNIALTFNADTLTKSFIVDDIVSDTEGTVCFCQKQYRGELITTCESCKMLFHPICLQAYRKLEPNGTKWPCKYCWGLNMDMQEDEFAETEYTESLKSLIGKRPNSHSESEEEPNPNKKINCG